MISCRTRDRHHEKMAKEGKVMAKSGLPFQALQAMCFAGVFATFTGTPHLKKLPFDPLKDLTPITMYGTSPMILVVNAALPVRSVAELIAYAKTQSRQAQCRFDRHRDDQTSGPRAVYSGSRR
jgi:hypothetical protein